MLSLCDIQNEIIIRQEEQEEQLQYSQTLTKGNLTFCFGDQGREQDERKAEKYRKHLYDGLTKSSPSFGGWFNGASHELSN